MFKQDSWSYRIFHDSNYDAQETLQICVKVMMVPVKGVTNCFQFAEEGHKYADYPAGMIGQICGEASDK